MIKSLSLSLVAVSTGLNISGIPGAVDDPAMMTFYNTTTTRATAASIASCQAYPTGTNIPWSDVARDWVQGGGRPEDCAAALIVASGETSCTAAGCLSVVSGIWQVTSPDMPPPSNCPDGDTNPCCSVDYVRNHLQTYGSSSTNKTTSFQVACMGEFNKGNGWAGDPTNPDATMPPSTSLDVGTIVTSIVPADHSGGGLGGTQSNWIGPFCHEGGISCEANDPYCTSSKQTGITGDNWGGGSEWAGSGAGDQLFPFPYYYYAKFLESQGDPTTGMTGDMHCRTIPPNAGCGGIPSQQVADCEQPVSGMAPAHQECFNGFVDAAVTLANKLCQVAYDTV